MNYRFQLEQFEGPLDVLLGLIEKEKLDITQVSLAQITDQFLEYIDQNENINLEQLSAFLSVATRLILIKSRALLPILTFTEEEEESIQDLEEHLRLYQLFREQAKKLEEMIALNNRSYTRESFLGLKSIFYPPKEIDADDLKDSLMGIIGSLEPIVSLPERELKTIISLEERMLEFKSALTERVVSSFHELLGSTSERLDVIISFLALLELVKQRYLSARQSRVASNIELTRHEL
jgi:segregation and condensation protein A